MRRAVLVLVVLVFAFSGGRRAHAQVSPGPLALPHRNLEGNLNCLKCHGPQRGHSMDAQCLACHKEIASLVGQSRGFHGHEAAKDCARCHPEHGGVEFKLIAWEAPPEQFDHRRTGWPLEGKHAPLKCAHCHGKPEFKREAVQLAPGKPGPSSYLGLDPACGTCHEDVHKGALGPRCGACHTAASFRVPEFDHAKTAYPLSGKHQTVACAKCHMAPRLALPVDREGRPRPLFKPLPHDECSACHQDPHAGRLGGPCGRCHVTEGFKIVRREAFDHARTRYPLRGGHVNVKCERCHDRRAGGWGERPAFDRCGACHRDAHDGQATLAGRAADCDACHTVDAYTPSTYTVQRHAESAYPLLGKHREVPCRSCHPKTREAVPAGSAGILLRRRHDLCISCHADAHAGQLAQRLDGGACEGCHRVDTFKPAVYTVEDHRRAAFALDGRHAAVECAACHRPRHPGPPVEADRKRLGVAAVDFRPGRECAVCHTDPHAGRFGPQGERPVANGCLGCHTTRVWTPSLVDEGRHKSLGFPLDGAHRAVPCSVCHKELAPSLRPVAAVTLRTLLFKDTRRRCEECHEGPHGEQFAARPDKGACASCHDAESFRPARRFDHDRDAAFRLAGAHARVPCAKCHVARTDAAGRPRTIYRPTPRACVACHAGAAPAAPSGQEAR